MKRLPLTVVCGLWSAMSSASPTAGSVRSEIDALLAKLQASGCQLNRNGSWYTGAEAKDHLLRKLEYLEGKGTVQRTEQFIELAASKSSSSGKPYQVKCAGEQPVESQLWLTKQLSIIRSSSSQPKP
jgi:hypothetical protein